MVMENEDNVDKICDMHYHEVKDKMVGETLFCFGMVLNFYIWLTVTPCVYLIAR